MHNIISKKLFAKTVIKIEPRELEDTILVIIKRKKLAKKLSAKTRKA